MATVELYVGDGLSISKLQVKLDEIKKDNELSVRCDGLYVSGKGLWGLKLKDKQYNHGVHVNISPWGLNWLSDNKLFDGHVCCDCTVHRCWNAKWGKPDESDLLKKEPILVCGKNEDDHYRPKADWVLPGDMFRIRKAENSDEWIYYLITEVSTGPGSLYDVCTGCHQRIYPFEDEDGNKQYSEYGNPKWHYTKEKNPHYTVEVDPGTETEDEEEIADMEYNAPEICPICGQPILAIPEGSADDLIGYPGNSPVAWVKLYEGGDF